MPDKYDYSELKRKLRKLKKLEKSIRQGYHDHKDSSLMKSESKLNLVWNDFFDLHEISIRNVKYPISKIVAMDKDEYKEMVNEFLTYVYIRTYREKGLLHFSYYDPEMLTQLGLPYDANTVAVKKRFRELIKKYHPDTGGDVEKFLELMNEYKEFK